MFTTPLRRALGCLLAALALVSLCPSAFAKSSEWPDPAKPGKTFRGEPMDVVGPFALFRTGATSGRRLLLRSLSQEDQVRLYKEVNARPARAAKWSEAKGKATSEVVGTASRIVQKNFVPADFSTLPEPEWLLIIKGSQNDGPSWSTVNALHAVYRRIQRVRPGLLEALFVGVRHDEAGHRNIATSTHMPWLVANFKDQRSYALLADFAPREGVHLTLLSRNGAPVLGAEVSDPVELRRFVAGLTELIGFTHPDNGLSWPDRFGYAQATRPLAATAQDLPVELLGNPLRVEVMRKYGIQRVSARLSVDEKGAVTAVEWDPSCAFPAKVAPALQQLFTKSLPLLPAYRAGSPVASTYTFTHDMPKSDSQAEADLAWLSGVARKELPLTEWMVLKPIPVEESVFSGSSGAVDERGVVQMSAFNVQGGNTVSRKTQLNAFNTDFFGEAGPGAVAPNEGDKQVVDEREYTWNRVKAEAGHVDFREGAANCDYSVGYAWTEFESPEAQEAWLGLGSDDGVKIWLNGTQVLDKWVRRPSQVDDDVVPLQLRKGKNQMLIKIQNATIDWSFDTRLMVR